jgi:enoyl-CoA hydratase/carnithine racemase
MAYEQILYEVAERIATITLNRPDRMNAWTPVIERELRDAMGQAARDDGVRVIVLTGAGRAFCAGADMQVLQGIESTRGAGNPELTDTVPFDAGKRADWQTRHTYYPSIGKPIIGMLNGATAGLGLVHALYCDLRFAAENAAFTTAFSRRGLIAEHGISWMLPRIVGHANALDLLLSGRKFYAPEALTLGLVNRVYPAEQLREATYAYAREMAQFVSPRSMAVIKRQMYDVPFQTMAEAVADANREMRASFDTADFKEGVAHYVEKRAPNFTGR